MSVIPSDVRGERWAARVAELREWKREHGRWPSTASTDSVERSLAGWLGNQRSGRAMTEQRRNLLDSDCPGWDSITRLRFGGRSFSSMVDELTAWRRAHGQAWPSAKSADDLERSLGRWLENQRRRTALGTERDRVLDEHHPGWRGHPTRSWYERLDHLIGWRPEHHHRWPSSKAADNDERSLGHWLLEQRRRPTEDRSKILDVAVPGWRSVRNATWHANLDQVVGWRTRHHSLPSGVSDDPEERRLGSWLWTQRSNADEHRQDLLDAKLPGWRDDRRRRAG